MVLSNDESCVQLCGLSGSLIKVNTQNAFHEIHRKLVGRLLGMRIINDQCFRTIYTNPRNSSSCLVSNRSSSDPGLSSVLTQISTYSIVMAEGLDKCFASAYGRLGPKLAGNQGFRTLLP
jgi:hypothetical protein